MILSKVALYLEYIAFNLRKEESMKKSQQPTADQPEALAEDASLPEAEPDAPTGGGSQFARTDERKTTRGLAAEIQAMAKIDRVMSELEPRYRTLVVGWFLDKFCHSCAKTTDQPPVLNR